MTCLRAHKRLECMGKCLGCDGRPIVSEARFPGAVGDGGQNGEVGAFGRGVDCVGERVGKRVTELVGVDVAERRRARRACAWREAPLPRVRPGGRQHANPNVVRIGGLQPNGFRAAVLEERGDERVESLRLAHDSPDVLFDDRVVGDAIAEQLRGGGNAVDRTAKLVGERRGHVLRCFHALARGCARGRRRGRSEIRLGGGHGGYYPPSACGETGNTTAAKRACRRSAAVARK